MGVHSVPTVETVAAIERLKELPLLQAQYRAAVDVLNRSTRETFLRYVELGFLVAETSKAGSAAGPASKFDEADYRLLATVLGPYRSPCQFGKYLVEVFTTAELEAFLARESDAGYVITKGHVRHILPLLRPQWPPALELFYKQSPTPAQFCDLIWPRSQRRGSAVRAPRRNKEQQSVYAAFHRESSEEVARHRIENSPRLRARYRAAIELSNEIFSATVRDRIELGRIGLATRNDTTLRSTPKERMHAASAVKLLATALGMHYETFRESLKLVETFTADELEMFCTRQSDAGMPITIVHLHWLAMVHPEDKRNELIDFFYADSLPYQWLGRMCIRHLESQLANTGDEAELALDDPAPAVE
jgi:hypothetical protein